MNSKQTISNSLFWKISGVISLVLILLGIVFALISSYSASNYYNEVTQRLNKELAQFTVDHTNTFDETGAVDTTAIQDIMHSMMIINPAVEVYLLDPAGKIITYVAPYKKVKLKEVDLTKVKGFIAKKGDVYCLGDDPRDPNGQKVFSAAPIKVDDKIQGYYYIILAGEKQGSLSSTLFGSYMLKTGLKIFLVTLLGALLISLLAIWFLTKNLQHIIDRVRRFKEGDYASRIDLKAKGDLTVLGGTFNEMADTIVRNMDEIKAVETLRRELTANISHDLRTPLSIIHGYIETMQMKNETLSVEDRKNYLDIVMKSTGKLGNMITQLFELSKLEANQIQPEKEPFFISELADSVVQKYEILAKEKDIDLELKMSKELPLVFADVGMVERVIQNLMDNALKYTPNGGHVTLELLEEDKTVVVKISDTGPGIPESEKTFIFERYHRLKSGDNNLNNDGSGLGLAIVKKILDIHSSTIEVRNNPSKGATFLFQLPVHFGMRT